MVPLHNEAAGLPALHAHIADAVARLTAARPLHVEIVYVDDGSGDDTATVARDLPTAGLDVQVLSLRAISARRRRCSPGSITRGSAPCCSWTATGSTRRT